ncbi:hypothetical protein LJ737_15775 [Hymenobacter sp. 15J16-1T3B]|uniref:hypothetical protein n=1 Tax=Hymenobacter sp. 15J16-1T3B TaxID=2886941 RepID=UPI001D12C9C0|nr:hypothetical protein [Hymenobacter sp. 15J16-1T3B]MCC3158704.1 hypothetical protein [Hymenobacter sp. 15J16-1T3B]
MNWQQTGTILTGFGIVLVVIGLLLRFKAGRWLLGALLVVLTLASLFSGDWTDPGTNIDSAPHKASRWLLLIGGGSLLISWGITSANR